MAGLPWVAVGAATIVEGTTVAAAAVVGGGVAAAAGPGLDVPTGRGEELRTWGLKLCPSRVFTMAGLRKEMRGWDENKRKGGGGGGVGLNRRVREGERLNPFNIHKWVVSGYGLKHLENLMGCRKRKVVGAKFRRLRKFESLEISTLHQKLLPSAIPGKKRSPKIIRIQK